MTREEARKAAEVMLSYANGEKVEVDSREGWTEVNGNCFFNWSTNIYRVKPKLGLRPFKDKEECWNEMLNHKPFGWVTDGYYQSTISVKENSIVLAISSDEYSYKDAVKTFRFVDGTPFGINDSWL